MVNYIDFKNSINNELKAKRNIYKPIFKFIDSNIADKMKGFYLKGLYLDNQELYIFISGKLFIIEIYEKGGYVIKVHPLKLESITLIQNKNSIHFKKLQVSLENGESFDFDSKEDAVENWREEYSKEIESIFQWLILQEDEERVLDVKNDSN